MSVTVYFCSWKPSRSSQRYRANAKRRIVHALPSARRRKRAHTLVKSSPVVVFPTSGRTQCRRTIDSPVEPVFSCLYTRPPTHTGPSAVRFSQACTNYRHVPPTVLCLFRFYRFLPSFIQPLYSFIQPIFTVRVWVYSIQRSSNQNRIQKLRLLQYTLCELFLILCLANYFLENVSVLTI